jgi:putative sporulation protein YtaF
MGFFSLVLVAIAVSIDGFWGGFSFGLRKTKITSLSLVIISTWSIIFTMISMIIGQSIQHYVPLEFGKYLGCILLLLLGVFTLKEGLEQKEKTSSVSKEPFSFSFKDLLKILNNPILADIDHENDIKPLEGCLFGIAVALDASIAAFTLSFYGFNPYLTPFLFGITHFILIGMGNVIATNKFINSTMERVSILPGIILITIGLLRLL